MSAADDYLHSLKVDEFLGPDPEASTATPAAPATPSASPSWTKAVSTLGHYDALAQAGIYLGINHILGLPGDIESLGNAYLPGFLTAPMTKGAGPFGLPGPGKDSKGNWLLPNQSLPTSQDITARSNAVGSTGLPNQQPQNETENYIQKGIIGATAGAITGPAGALAGGAGGLAAEGAKEAFPDVPWAPAAAGFIAGLGVGGLASRVSAVSAAKGAAKEATAAQQSVDQTGQALIAAQDAASRGRFANSRILDDAKTMTQAEFDTAKEASAKALADQHSAADQAIGAVANGLGKSQTLQDAGNFAQQTARDWLTNAFPSGLNKAFAPVDAAIPSDATAVPVAFRGALAQINRASGTLEPAAQLLKSSTPSRLQSVMNDVMEKVGDASKLSPLVTRYKEIEGKIAAGTDTPADTNELLSLKDQINQIPAVNPNTKITWSDMQSLRTTLGDALATPKVVSDVGAQNLKQLYAALTSDMRNVADNYNATGLFDQANQEATRLFNLAEGPVSRIVSSAKATAKDPAPGDVANSFLNSGKRGDTDLAALRSEPGLSPIVDELGAAAIKQDKWLTLSPEAKSTLVPSPTQSGLIDAAVAAKADATKQWHDATLAAQAKRDENVKTVQDYVRGDNFELGQNSITASRAAQSAKERLSSAQEAVKSSKPNAITALPLHSLATGYAAGQAAYAAAAFFGLPVDALTRGHLAEFAGAMAPLLWSGAKKLAGNPGPTVAGAIGGNVITDETPARPLAGTE